MPSLFAYDIKKLSTEVLTDYEVDNKLKTDAHKWVKKTTVGKLLDSVTQAVGVKVPFERNLQLSGEKLRIASELLKSLTGIVAESKNDVALLNAITEKLKTAESSARSKANQHDKGKGGLEKNIRFLIKAVEKLYAQFKEYQLLDIPSADIESSYDKFQPVITYRYLMVMGYLFPEWQAQYQSEEEAALPIANFSLLYDAISPANLLVARKKIIDANLADLAKVLEALSPESRGLRVDYTHKNALVMRDTWITVLEHWTNSLLRTEEEHRNAVIVKFSTALLTRSILPWSLQNLLPSFQTDCQIIGRRNNRSQNHSSVEIFGKDVESVEDGYELPTQAQLMGFETGGKFEEFVGQLPPAESQSQSRPGSDSTGKDVVQTKSRSSSFNEQSSKFSPAMQPHQSNSFSFQTSENHGFDDLVLPESMEDEVDVVTSTSTNTFIHSPQLKAVPRSPEKESPAKETPKDGKQADGNPIRKSSSQEFRS